MTIAKGQAWGREVSRPAGLRVASTDAEAAELLADGADAEVSVASGDLHRTIGGRAIDDRVTMLELPIDLLRVRFDDGREATALAHVVVQSPAVRGGWWRGAGVMVMNAQFLGDWHVVSRGHPNDGRAESVAWGSDFGLRQRWQARRRLPTGGHVPHPAIETRSFRERSWHFEHPMEVRVDGRERGRTTTLHVAIDADAAVIYG